MERGRTNTGTLQNLLRKEMPVTVNPCMEVNKDLKWWRVEEQLWRRCRLI